MKYRVARLQTFKVFFVGLSNKLQPTYFVFMCIVCYETILLRRAEINNCLSEFSIELYSKRIENFEIKVSFLRFYWELRNRENKV